MEEQQSRLILNGGTRVVLDEPQDKNMDLYAAIEKYQRGVWVLPEHQREFVWDNAKVQAWIDRLAVAVEDRGRKPVGVIVTYQIADGHPSPIFINDGSQRVRATLSALQSPEAFGYNQKTVEEILNAINISVQHRHYRSQDEALEDFQLLNMGTALTPREMCKGILANHPQYKIVWEPLFNRFHEVMRRVGGGFVVEPDINRRVKHKFERHDFSIIVRWLGNPLGDHRRVATMELRKELIDKGEVIETELRRICHTLKPEELRSEIDNLIGHIQRQAALSRTIWEEVRPQIGTAMSATLFRWMVDVSIWVRKTGVPQNEWEEFVRQLLTHTQGTAIAQHPQEMRRRVTLGLGSITKLNSVCEIIGSSLYRNRPPRQRSRTPKLKGFDESHVRPFSTHGNGPTVVEPASRNRARGASPIKDEEQENT